MKRVVLVFTTLLFITIMACSNLNDPTNRMRNAAMENTAFNDYRLNKFWPVNGFFEDELVLELERIRNNTLALFKENGSNSKKLVDFHKERIKKFYRIAQRPHIKSFRILRQFEKKDIHFIEYEILLDNNRKTALITAKKTDSIPDKAVVGLHGTNDDREYFLDVLSHPVRKGKAHKSEVGFLLPLVNAGFLVVCPDLPGMGMDYPGKNFDDKTFAHNVIFADQLARLCGLSYINESVYRLMAINDFVLNGTCGPIKKLGYTGFSLGGQCAVCVAACDERVDSVLELMGVSTYEKFIKNSHEKINGCTYVYGSGLLEHVGDQWVFLTGIFPRSYKKIICIDDKNVNYEGVTDICELMRALYHARNTTFEFTEYPQKHFLNNDMKTNAVKWFEKM